MSIGRWTRRGSFAFLLFLAVALPLRAASAPKVALDRTEARRLQSKIAGQEYRIDIRYPDGYERSEKRYPVVYLLDGDLMFSIGYGVIRYLEWGQSMPEVIAVGIAYGGLHGPAKGGPNMRDRDFSVFPGQSAYVEGGGEKFLRFLREELIPYVDRELPTDPTDRTLVGASRSADFTMWTLLTSPDLFRRYVMIDSFHPDYFKLEEALATKRKALPKHVFVGRVVPGGGMQRFSDRMQSRGYEGLAYEHAVLASARHFASPGEGLTRGLKSVFGKRSVYEHLLPLTTRPGVDAIVAEYRRLRKEEPDWNYAETELRSLGNLFAATAREADAVRIFQLNLETHPDAIPTLLRLAAMYEKLGERERAIATYRRIRELDPNHKQAAEALESLNKD